MNNAMILPIAVFDSNTKALRCEGCWNVHHVHLLQTMLREIEWPKDGVLKINGKAITHLDTAGAWLLNQLHQRLTQHGLSVHLEEFSQSGIALLTWFSQIKKQSSRVEKETFNTAKKTISTWRYFDDFLTRVGKAITQECSGLTDYLTFVGQLSAEFIAILTKRHRMRWGIITHVVYTAGVHALIMIALLSLMIGVVIAYQMGVQLRNYGANIYIIDLLGLAMLREFAPLMTAIMLAGRTGSSYTAELGMMKINQEIDALNTMSVPPAGLLLLPRVFGLFIAAPLLTMWADIFGILGGMLIAKNMLHITLYEFFDRFQRVIPLKALLVGIAKAPVFALIIASVSCFQGMQVIGSTYSIGQRTTRSVVFAIFFVVAADAIFSILFNQFGI